MFRDDAQRQECHAMILKGDMKPKEIVEKLGGNVSTQDVYNERANLRNAGKLQPANGGGHSKKKATAKGKVKDEFAESLDAELDRLNEETAKFERLMERYSADGGFGLHLEKKIEANKEKIALLSEIKETA